jgi:hypothetical protein
VERDSLTVDDHLENALRLPGNHARTAANAAPETAYAPNASSAALNVALGRMTAVTLASSAL